MAIVCELNLSADSTLITYKIGKKTAKFVKNISQKDSNRQTFPLLSKNVVFVALHGHRDLALP